MGVNKVQTVLLYQTPTEPTPHANPTALTARLAPNTQLVPAADFLVLPLEEAVALSVEVATAAS